MKPADIGAVGDGVADDTDALQSLIDPYTLGRGMGQAFIPVGKYRITRPLLYQGCYGFGFRLSGEVASLGPGGTQIFYDGPVGDVALDLAGANCTTIEHIAIDAGGKARACLNLRFDDERGIGCSSVYLGYLTMAGGYSDDPSVLTSGIVAGYNADGSMNSSQCDHIVVEKCNVTGGVIYGATGCGVRLGWANCKNFAIRDSTVVGCKIGVSFKGSGFCDVTGFCGGGNTDVDFEATTGNMRIAYGNSEGSGSLFRGSTGLNSGGVEICGFSWASAVARDIVIQHQAHISLRNNYIWSMNEPGKVPLIYLDLQPGCPTSLDSVGNYYANATCIPAVGQHYALLTDFSRVRSFGDYGGMPGSLIMFPTITGKGG